MLDCQSVKVYSPFSCLIFKQSTEECQKSVSVRRQKWEKSWQFSNFLQNAPSNHLSVIRLSSVMHKRVLVERESELLPDFSSGIGIESLSSIKINNIPLG